MKGNTREERWGRKRGPERDNRAEQEGDGATNEGSAGGESQSARHGLQHPGQSSTQPRTRYSRGGSPVPRTGPSGAGPERINKAPWTGTSRAPTSQEDAHPDRGIQKRPRWQAAGPQALEHPGGCGPKPWTGRSRDGSEQPRTGTSRVAQEGGEDSGSKEKTPTNDLSSGESQPAQDHLGQTGTRSRTGRRRQ